MRRNTAWIRNDGGVAVCSSLWLFFACWGGLAHIITILAGQGRVATRKAAAEAAAAAKGMPKKTWLVALGRQNARQRDGAALGGYAVSRRRSAVSGPREVDVRPVGAGGGAVRVCNEGVDEWQYAETERKEAMAKVSSPLLQQRTHPNASTALPAATPLGGEVTCGGRCRDASSCCYSSSLASGRTPGRDEQACEGQPG